MAECLDLTSDTEVEVKESSLQKAKAPGCVVNYQLHTNIYMAALLIF